MKTLLGVMFAIAAAQAMADGKIMMNVGLSPAGSFQGTSEKAKGNLFKQGDTFTSDKISVSLESFKTGIELRDQHLWKHFNHEKFPKATMTEIKGSSGKAEAKLELHGVTKPIKMTYSVAGPEVKGKFTVKASDFNLPPKEYLGVGVSDIVEVEFSYPFRDKK